MKKQECPHHAANGDQAGREMCPYQHNVVLRFIMEKL